MKRYKLHREAEDEYVSAAEYYSNIDPELGGRFYDEIERLIREIRQQPVRYRLVEPPIRRHFSTVFPYALLYVDQPDRILIIAVMPMQRAPGYWKHRLE